MCTAITYQTKDFYMGRTLDYEFSYGDQITITPRNYEIRLRHRETLRSHFAMIGMAHVADDYPLYYDAVNEKGLGIAGLNFVGNAVYAKVPEEGHDQKQGDRETDQYLAQFELIPFLLGKFSSVAQVREYLSHAKIVDTPFSEKYPVAGLHWLIADEEEAITVESTKDGMHIYGNPVGVLTNNPPFPQQMFHLNHYRSLSAKQPEKLFSEQLELPLYSRGMGAIGLPGDLSSDSRFVRAAFTKLHAVSGDSESESVSQFFHILGSVEQSRGCCEVADGKYEITLYTSCWNANRGIYYYTTYDNHQITAVDMHREHLDGSILTRYMPIHGEQIKLQN